MNGFHGDRFEVGILGFEVTANAGDRATGTNAGDNRVDVISTSPPRSRDRLSFRGWPGWPDSRIVVASSREDRSRPTRRLADGAFHAIGRGSQNEVRPHRSQERPPLNRHRFWHGQR